MNKHIFLVAALVSGVAASVMAYTTLEFPGWPPLIQSSPAIVIARCVATPVTDSPGNNVVQRDMRGLIESDIEVVSVLKGDTNSTANRLISAYEPFQNEFYLIFVRANIDGYQAFEDYRIVPLGTEFNPETLQGKTLEQQIQMLLQRRLDNLNRQMKEEEQEKDRLEQALQN
jgi:hypothetical protein